MKCKALTTTQSNINGVVEGRVDVVNSFPFTNSTVKLTISASKKQLMVLALAGCLIGAAGCEAGYVTAQPANVVYTRPVAPGPDYIWIDGDWGWSGGRYVWHEGRWGRPRAGHAWQGGHWQSGSRGYRWQRGHWK